MFMYVQYMSTTLQCNVLIVQEYTRWAPSSSACTAVIVPLPTMKWFCIVIRVGYVGVGDLLECSIPVLCLLQLSDSGIKVHTH